MPNTAHLSPSTLDRILSDRYGTVRRWRPIIETGSRIVAIRPAVRQAHPALEAGTPWLTVDEILGFESAVSEATVLPFRGTSAEG